MKLPNWIKNAYKSTDVPWAKSQSEIYKMLGELGIYEIRFTNRKDGRVLKPIYQTNRLSKV